MGDRLYNEHFEFDRWSEDVGKFSVGDSQGNYHTGAIINILRAKGVGRAGEQGGGVESGKRLFYDLPYMMLTYIFSTVKVVCFLYPTHPLLIPIPSTQL